MADNHTAMSGSSGLRALPRRARAANVGRLAIRREPLQDGTGARLEPLAPTVLDSLDALALTLGEPSPWHQIFTPPAMALSCSRRHWPNL
jgi:hypothetical protein